MNDQSIAMSGSSAAVISYGSITQCDGNGNDNDNGNGKTVLCVDGTTVNHLPRYCSNSNNNNTKTNVRFMAMIFTGITFLLCIIFIMTQSYLSILQRRHMIQMNQRSHLVRHIHCSSDSSDCRTNATMHCIPGTRYSTFRQLGQAIVPLAYQDMIHTIRAELIMAPVTDTSSAIIPQQQQLQLQLQPPGNVNRVRKHILYVRDLLDIFSPIYSNATSSTSNCDTHQHTTRKSCDSSWSQLRSLLDHGYSLIGDYQDLDHSHVSYTTSEIMRINSKIVHWYNRFTVMTNRTTMSSSSDETDSTHLDLRHIHSKTTNTQNTVQFLSSDQGDCCNTAWYTHSSASRLFWKGLNVGLLYRPDETLVSNRQSLSIDRPAIMILQLLFRKQVHLARKYYIKAYAHVSVLTSEREQIDYQYVKSLNLL
jgi:hypothetical protein